MVATLPSELLAYFLFISLRLKTEILEQHVDLKKKRVSALEQILKIKICVHFNYLFKSVIVIVLLYRLCTPEPFTLIMLLPYICGPVGVLMHCNLKWGRVNRK